MTITCPCDKVPKKTAVAIIKHIERHHTNKYDKNIITLNTRELKVVEGITSDHQCSTSNNAHFAHS